MSHENSDSDGSCLGKLDDLFKCCGVSHQFGKIYRESEFDNCTRYFVNFKNCVMAKTVTNEAKKQVPCFS